MSKLKNKEMFCVTKQLEIHTNKIELINSFEFTNYQLILIILIMLLLILNIAKSMHSNYLKHKIFSKINNIKIIRFDIEEEKQ